MIEDGKLVVNMGIHGVGDHSMAGMKLWHGAEIDGQYKCRDGTVPVRDNGDSMK